MTLSRYWFVALVLLVLSIGLYLLWRRQDVPSHPMFLIMNTAVGGAAGRVVDSTLPQAHSIDYVKVYS